MRLSLLENINMSFAEGEEARVVDPNLGMSNEPMYEQGHHDWPGILGIPSPERIEMSVLERMAFDERFKRFLAGYHPNSILAGEDE